MAGGLKPRVKAGFVPAWIPGSRVAPELARGELVAAGNDSWALALETCFYRRTEGTRSRVLQQGNGPDLFQLALR